MLTTWALIPFIAFCTNLALCMYTLNLGLRHPVNRIFALLSGSLAWWALLTALYSVVVDPASYNLAVCLSAPVWIFIGPFILHFVLVVLRGRPLLREHPLFALVYLPGVPLLLLRWFTPLIFTVAAERAPWGLQQEPGALLIFYWLYIQLFMIATLGVLVRGVMRAPPGVERRRVLCLAAGTAIPFIGGTITNLILPLLGYHVYWSAVGLTTAGCALYALGIFRFRLLRPTLRGLSGQVLRNMSQPVFLTDQNGIILEANEAAQALAEQSSEGLIGMPVAEFFDHGSETWDELLAQRDAEGQVINIETTWTGLGGERVPVLLSFSTLCGPDGTVEGYLLLGVDYRDLKRAELALRQSEELYRTLFESPVQGIMVAGDTILQVNEKAAAMFRTTVEDLIGRPATDLWPETQADGRSSQEVAAERSVRIDAGEPQTFPWRNRRLDGTLMDCEVSSNRVTVGGQLLYQVAMRDVTEQQRLEQAVEHLHQGLAGVVGEAFFTALAEHLAEWLGVYWVQISEVADAEATQGRAVAVWRSGGPEEVYEFALAGTPCGCAVEQGFTLVPEGAAEVFPAASADHLREHAIQSYVGTPLRDRDGHVVGILCALDQAPLTIPPRLLEPVFALFAERAAAELCRLRAEAQERAHAEQLRDLQKMESVAMLAGGVAHDFNNILVGVLGHAALAREEVPADSPAQRSLEVIEDSAERAVGLTSQLLAYARGGKQNPVPVDLRSLVADLLDMLGAVLPKAVKVQCLLPEGFSSVLADPSQMQQVIMNLCTNAGEAMADGGGTLTVQLGDVAGPAHCPAQGDDGVEHQLLLTVQDTGCGMDPETARRIFEPFFSTKGFGRGLGLAAAQGIVVNHGGCLHCESEPGRGTTFRLYLPAHDAPVKVSEEAAPPAPTPTGSETILVADDELVVREFACDVLRDLGYHVMVAKNGDEALALYRTHRDEIDLVLLDMIMPGRDGLDTLEALRTVDPQVKAVLTSGYAAEQLPLMQNRAHATAFLKKPYRPRTLAAMVRDVLSV